MHTRTSLGWRATTRRALVLLTCLTSILLADEGLCSEKGPSAPAHVRLVVLDDCDSDFKTPPFDDAAIFLTAEGRIARRIGGLNTCDTIGGCRAVAVWEDGASLVVCENVTPRIVAYEIATGDPLWSSPGKFTSAIVHRGIVYALKTDHVIYGREIVAFDGKGGILRQADLGGHDIAADPNANVLWLAGGDIKKCDPNLNVLWQIDPIPWCASSVDVVPDGSAWVAEREHIQAGGTDRLLHVSPSGAILGVIPLDMSPMCVRVDPSENSLWVTGIRLRRTRKPSVRMSGWPRVIRFRDDYRVDGAKTCKYSTQGKLLCRLDYGGDSLALDPSDGSVWIAGRSKVWHCSRDGKELHTFDTASDGQKWIGLAPHSR